MSEVRAMAIGLPGGDRVEIDAVKMIGRDRECDVVLDDPMASAQHAQLEPAEGGVKITDLGSGNGTLVEGVKIAGPVVARPGEKITIGLQLLTVLGADDPADPVAPFVPDSGSVVAEVDPAAGTGISVVTAPAAGGEAGEKQGEADSSSGINPAARTHRKLDDVELPALGFAAIAGGAFVLVALVAFGVLAVVL